MEQLKQQAEAQQRRPAPPLDGKVPSTKKRKVDQPDDDGDDPEAEVQVGRFSYAADAAIAAGSTCLLASCGFNRQRSAAKELLSIVKPLLPERTQLQMVKVGCRGLAVVRVEAAAAAAAADGQGQEGSPVPVTDIVGQVLQQIEEGKLKHTKFCERIVPAETTCLLTAAALEAALMRVVTSYLAKQQQHNSSSSCSSDAAAAGGDGDGGAADIAPAAAAAAGKQQQPVEFAVLYKSRGVDKQILADMEKEEAKHMPAQDQQQAAGGAQQQEAEEGPDAAAGTARAAAAAVADNTDGSQAGPDRQRVIDMAAAVMERCCKDIGGAKVNLSKPQVVIMVEVMPLLKHQSACAVAMLPRSMMSSSHKLKIKACSGDANDMQAATTAADRAAGKA